MSAEFVEETGSILITLSEDLEEPVEIVHDGGAEVIITVANGRIIGVEILMSKGSAERLAKLLRRERAEGRRA